MDRSNLHWHFPLYLVSFYPFIFLFSPHSHSSISGVALWPVLMSFLDGVCTMSIMLMVNCLQLVSSCWAWLGEQLYFPRFSPTVFALLLVIFSPQPFGIETRCICAVPLLFSVEAAPLVIPFSLIVLSTVYMLIIPIFLYLVFTFGYRIISNFSFQISTRYLKLSQT